ncbi:MAG: cation:proton antiporter [Halolamina sp.]
MLEGHLLRAAVAFLSLAAAGAVAVRLDQSVVPAYILAGVLVGPHLPLELGGVSLTLLESGPFVSTAAEIGIVLLLFFLGFEFSAGSLLEEKGELLAMGGIDLLVNAAVGVALGVAVGLPPTGVVLLAGVVYISSSGIITKSLTENGWLADPESEAILGTLVVEDVVIAVYLSVVSAVVLGGGSMADAAVSVGKSVLFLAALTYLAYRGSAHVGTLFDVRSDELFVLRVLGFTTFVAALALSVGVSEAVAAFFVGTMFSGSELVERIERLCLPLRDVFAAFFFFSIGLSTNVLLVVDVWELLLAAVVLTTASKLLSGFLTGRVCGLTDRRSFRVGLGLVARGEFSLVIATLAATSSVAAVRTVVPAFAVGYVLLMSVLGTLCIQYESVITDRFGVENARTREISA